MLCTIKLFKLQWWKVCGIQEGDRLFMFSEENYFLFRDKGEILEDLIFERLHHDFLKL